MKRARSYSSDTKAATVAFVKGSPEWEQIRDGVHERLPHHVLDQARVLSGGASADTIHRWITEDISPSAEKERLSHRGARPQFPEDMIKLAVGFAVDLRLDLQAVDRAAIVDFAHGFCGIKPQPQRVSEWLLNHGFSSQMSMARSSRMTSLEVANQAVDFLMNLRERNLQPNQILFMDETGLWSNVVERRTYHFRNLYEAHTSSFLHISVSSTVSRRHFPFLLSPTIPHSFIFLNYFYIIYALAEMLLSKRRAIVIVTRWQQPSSVTVRGFPPSTSKGKWAMPPRPVVAGPSPVKKQIRE